MVAAKESQTNLQISARNSTYLNHMALLQHVQNYGLPCLAPATPNSSVAFLGHYTPDFRGLNTGQQDTVGGVLNPNCNILHPTGSTYLNDTQCALPREFGVTDKVIDASCAPQKRFLIFDRSRSCTRLFFSPSFSPGNQILASKTHTNASGPCEQMATQMDQKFLIKPNLEENSDENNLSEGEGEMHEDTEELNALLYSDSDDDDDDGENDEVTSTGHSPFIIAPGYSKDKLREEHMEVANSDESPKRRRLLDGKYKKSSLANAQSLVSQPVSQCYEDDVESSCAGETSLCKREQKVKIRQALMTLANIIPGLNAKDPLSIIDKAIVYLKSMKTEAEAEAESLQHSYHGCKFTTSLPNCTPSQVESESLDQWGARNH